MSRKTAARPSNGLKAVYHSLPEHAQRIIVDDLITLLDEIPEKKAKRIISSATRLRSRLNTTQRPFRTVLDLKGKRKEINGLFVGLSRDGKRAFIGPEHSRRQEILDEVVNSLLVWLPDIWSVVFEHASLFDEAHQCLLYTAESLAKLLESNTNQCKCSLMNMEVDVHINRQDGRLLQAFHLVGVRNVTRAILWIWRDLLVSMSANTHEAYFRRRAPEMLIEIENSLGLRGLERVLYGGHPSLSVDFSRDGFEEDEIDPDLLEDQYCIEDEPDDSTITEEDINEGDLPISCACHYHGEHWSPRLNRHRLRLRSLILSRLTEAFGIMPSRALYVGILTISPTCVPLPALPSFYATPTKEESATRLHSMLAHSLASAPLPDTVATALDIATFRDGDLPWAIPDDDPEIADTLTIPSILTAHGHRLLPQHTRAVHTALGVYDSTALMRRHTPAHGRLHAQILAALREQIAETVAAAHVAIRSVFPKMDNKEMREEALAIQALRVASTERRARIVSFVDTLERGGPAGPAGFVNLGGFNIGGGPGGAGAAAGAAFAFQGPIGGGGGAAGGGGNGPPDPFTALLMGMGLPLGPGGPGGGGGGAGPGAGAGAGVFGPAPGGANGAPPGMPFFNIVGGAGANAGQGLGAAAAGNPGNNGGFMFAPGMNPAPPPGFGFGAFMDDDNPMQPDPFHVLAMHGPGGAGQQDDDPDIEDLREEMRPRIKERFEMWTEAADLVGDHRMDSFIEETSAQYSGGAKVLQEAYDDIIARMPIFRSPDIPAEMVDRVMDISKYHYTCDALEALSSFCKLQRKKMAARTSQKAKRKGKERKKQSNKGNWFSFAGPSSLSIPDIHSPFPVSDNDSNDDDLEPPPLEPIPNPATPLAPAAASAGYPFFGGIEDVD